MNIEELFRNQFGPESARQLAQELGLDPEQAARLLDRIVRSQLETVAQQAKSDAGRAQVLDAITKLPRFRNVEHALTEQGGAASLQLAGEILGPTLLGGGQDDMAGQLSRVEGAPMQSITRLMNMSLPLLLSFIGQAGVNASTITQIMSTIRGLDLRPRAAAGSYVSRAAAAAANAPQFVDGGQTPVGETKKSAEVPSAGTPATGTAEVDVPKVDAAKAEDPKPAETKPAETKPVATKPVETKPTQAPATPTTAPEQTPELVKDTDYSKDSVVSALLDGAEVPAPDAVVSGTQPQPVVQTKENPYRSEDAEVAVSEQASKTEVELVEDTDYSKDSVVSALLGNAEEPASPSAVSASVASSAQPDFKPEPGAEDLTKPDLSKSEPIAEPVKAGDGDVEAEAGMPAPAALAAAAAAAGIGAGAVRGVDAGAQAGQVQQPQQPAGSPWKSAKPIVTGGQTSQAKPAASGPRAVPVTPASPVTATPVTPIAPPKPATAGAQASAAAKAAAVGAAAAGATTAGMATGALSVDGLLDTFREQFSAPAVSALAESVGFAPHDSAKAVQGTTAVLLAALSQKGRDEAGAADILKLGDDFGRVSDAGRLNTSLLGNRAELGALEVRGLSVLDRVLDNPSQVGGRLGTALGTSGEQAGRLLALMTPFVLGLLGSRARAAGTAPAALSSLLSGLNPTRLQELLPEGLGSLGALLSLPLFGGPAKERATLLETKQAKAGAAAAAATTVAAKPAVTEKVVLDEKPAAPVHEPERHLTAAPAEPERKGGFPWWLLLLPLLAGLAWYFSQDREEPIPAPTTVSSATTSETSTVSASESGATSAPGTESTEASAADTTSATTTTSTTTTTQSVASAASANAVTDASGAVAGAVAVTSPAAGETVPDTGFTMSGTGAPDTTYQLLEDGVSVGTFASDAGGAWQADVAAPAAGDHVYSVQDDAGTEVLSVPVTVEATEAAAACSEPLTLSLNDGETVSAPFRFGGVGDASGYQVRVLRGGQEIGTKDITLAPNCTWNYLSQPGGEAGTTDAITYEVRSLDDLSGAPLQTINLNVVQAGE